jgi:hypothetical protein
VGRGRGQGGSKEFEFARGIREKVRGGCGFSSLMKPKKRENLLRHLHRRIFFLNFFCYEVIVKQIFKERPRLYYYRD